MSIGGRIREKRNELGWTQQTLAEKANITGAFLSEIETDKKAPSYKTLAALACAFGCSEGVLLDASFTDNQQGEDTVYVPKAWSWWGNIADEVYEIMKRGDVKEIAYVKSALEMALSVIDKEQTQEQSKPFSSPVTVNNTGHHIKNNIRA